MKGKVFNILKKEWLETRSATIVFAFLGIFVPVVAICGNFAFQSLPYPNAGILAIGGAVAVWLNATILCALTFVRERETRTFETLKRVCPDWKLAALGKFGLVALSTIATGLFFLAAVAIVDALDGWAFFGSFGRGSLLDGYNLGTWIKVASLCFAFCWGVFWTGRASRQASAIFLTVLCSLGCGLAFELVANELPWFETISTQDKLAARIAAIVAILAPVAIELVVLYLAPRGTRFGYLATETRADALDEANVVKREKDWEAVGSAPKPGGFWTLVRNVLAECALLARTPASVVVELALCFVLGLALVVGGRHFWYEPVVVLGMALFPIYYICFGSGLFQDAKSAESPMRSRLNVSSKSYWFASALVGLVVAAICGACVFGILASAILLDGRSIDWDDCWPIVAIDALAVLLATFGNLWSASLRGGRLVTGARTLVVFVVGGLIFPLFLGLVSESIHRWFAKDGLTQQAIATWSYGRHGAREGYYGFDSGETSVWLAGAGLALVVAILSVWFAKASYRAIARRMEKREKPGFCVLLPAIAMCALFLLAIRLPEKTIWAIPGVDGVGTKPSPWLEAELKPIPKSQKEYDRRVAKWEKTRAPIWERRIADPDAWSYSNYYKDDGKTFSEEMAKINAKGAVVADKTRWGIAEPFAELNARNERAKVALRESREGRRTWGGVYWGRSGYYELARNARNFAEFGELKPSPDSFENVELIKAARGKNDNVWEIALNNYVVTQPARDFYLDDALNARLPSGSTRYANVPAPLPLSSAPSADAEAYDRLILALQPKTNWVAAEVAERLISIADNARTRKEEEWPGSWTQINDASFKYQWIDPNDPTTSARSYGYRWSNPFYKSSLWSQNDFGVFASYPATNFAFAFATNEIRGKGRLSQTLGASQRLDAPFADKERLEPYLDLDGNELKTPDGRVGYRGDARSVKYAANDLAPGDSSDRERDAAFEIYPLYDAEGAPLLDENGARYHGVDYWAVDDQGEPIAIVPELVGTNERPSFLVANSREDIDLTNARRAVAPSFFPNPGVETTTIARVRAVKLFDDYGENSFMLGTLWGVYSPGASEAEPAKETFLYEEGDECSRYQRRRGIFADKRHIAKEGYAYAFDLPADMFANAEKLRAYVVKDVGVYEEAPKDYFLVENGRVYSKVQAVGLLTPNSWILNPSFDNYMDPKYEGNPVLIVEPLNWKEIE